MVNEILCLGRDLSLVEAGVKAINEVFGPQGKQPVFKRNLTYKELKFYSPNVFRHHFWPGAEREPWH